MWMYPNAGKAGWPAMTGLMLAPLVVGMRLPLLAMEAQRGGVPGRESVRAVSEKIAAAAEGMVAAQLSLFSSMVDFWPDIAAGRVPALASGVAVERSLRAALRPASRRVEANFSRLSSRF